MSALPRIVSLLPSATEICFALGLEEQLVGVSHECDFPQQALSKPQVTRSDAHIGLTSREIDALVRSQLEEKGSIYELDLALLEELQPNLILTQKLCTVCAVSSDEVVEMTRDLSSKPAVINLEPRTLDEVFETIQHVGELAKCSSDTLLHSLRHRIEEVKRSVETLSNPRTVVLEWVDPPFASGHWIPELIEIAGGESVLGFKHWPSRTVEWSAIAAVNPEVLIIAECGFGVERQLDDITKLVMELGSFGPLPEIWICDGSQYFSRPGPRLIETAELLAGIIHEERRDLLARFENGKDFIKIDTN